MLARGFIAEEFKLDLLLHIIIAQVSAPNRTWFPSCHGIRALATCFRLINGGVLARLLHFVHDEEIKVARVRKFALCFKAADLRVSVLLYLFSHDVNHALDTWFFWVRQLLVQVLGAVCDYLVECEVE